jgi:hypothetical protein
LPPQHHCIVFIYLLKCYDHRIKSVYKLINTCTVQWLQCQPTDIFTGLEILEIESKAKHQLEHYSLIDNTPQVQRKGEDGWWIPHSNCVLCVIEFNWSLMLRAYSIFFCWGGYTKGDDGYETKYILAP